MNVKFLHLVLGFVVFFGITSCVQNDDIFIPPTQGAEYVLTEIITFNAYDFNNDGVPTRDYIAEVGFCLDDESLEFNPNGTGFDVSRSFVDMRLDVFLDNDGFIVDDLYRTRCINEFQVDDFLWFDEGRGLLTLEYRDGRVLRFFQNRNEIYVDIPNSLFVEYVDVNSGRVLTDLEDVRLVYTLF